MDFNNGARSLELPKDWEKIRIKVMKRDGSRCRGIRHGGIVCNLPASEVDHIIRGSDHSMENLQALCSICHSRKTAAEAREARESGKREPAKEHPFFRRLKNRAE